MSVYQEWIYRSPHFFFAAIEKLRETDPDAAEKFEFHQIGRTPDWLKSMADRFGMGEQLISHGVLPHDEVIATLDTMDACLVTSLKVPGGADYCLASKTFDYIQAHKLLLGFVAEGSQRKFLEAVHGSVICPPDAAVENAQKLSRIAKKLDRFNFCKDELKKYRRCATAGALANIVLSTLR
jgi:glycosyltransferase involved in cell wall biosynthesis